MKGIDVSERNLRNAVAECIENWLEQDKTRTLIKLSEESGVAIHYVSNARRAMPGVGLRVICRILDCIGYNLQIVKKEW